MEHTGQGAVSVTKRSIMGKLKRRREALVRGSARAAVDQPFISSTLVAPRD